MHTTGDLAGDAATGDLDLLFLGDLDLDLDLEFSRTGDTERAGDTDRSLEGDLASELPPSVFIG